MSAPRLPSDAEIVAAIEQVPARIGASTAYLVGFLAIDAQAIDQETYRRLGRTRVADAMGLLGPKLASMRSRGILTSTRSGAAATGDIRVVWELAR